MQNLSQSRRQMAIVSTLICGGVLLSVTPSLGLTLYLMVGLALQFIFNLRRAWGLYAPLVSMALLLMLPGFTNVNRLFWVQGLLIVLAVMAVIEAGLYWLAWIRAGQFAREINESGQTQQLIISNRLLKESGLTDEERLFFKREIKHSYEQLTYLRQVQKVASQYLPTYLADIKLINAIFNELLGAPRQILNVSAFLYDHLPKYVQLTRSTLSVRNNVIKTDEDQYQIEQAQSTIQMLSVNFEQDYLKVTEDERESLKRQIKS